MWLSGTNHLTIKINGRAIDEYKDSNGRTFVEGRQGSAYTIDIGATYLSQKFVISVDGKNILTGDSTWTKGYVIDSHRTLSIPGWRIDRDKVAQFTFGSVGSSYSTDKANTGVIGVMVFDEVIPVLTDPIFRSRDWTYAGTGVNPTANLGIGICATNTMNIASSVSTTQNNLGTGWGQEQQFKTVETQQIFNSQPTAIYSLYYDDARGLERRGIQVKPKYQNAFPGLNDFGCPPYKSR